jgi:predicted heme/steroid binding protein
LSEIRTFTPKELSRYNGKHGAPAFVAYEGVVYDVTSSFLWQKGEHQVLHGAGSDLTLEMSQAPHTAAVFGKFPVVGVLITTFDDLP